MDGIAYTRPKGREGDTWPIIKLLTSDFRIFTGSMDQRLGVC